MFYIVGGVKNRRIDIGKRRTEFFKHVSDACLFNGHLLYYGPTTPPQKSTTVYVFMM